MLTAYMTVLKEHISLMHVLMVEISKNFKNNALKYYFKPVKICMLPTSLFFSESIWQPIRKEHVIIMNS